VAYKSTRRQWVKLWVNEWLDGTSRFELTPQQRLLWIDLLALAGRSRFPGEIYAGLAGNGSKVGYPIAYLAGVLQMDEVTTNNALKLLKEHCHITLDESAPEQYVIGIINWEKYQSEYLRQKTYRKVTTNATSRLLVEGEGEVEGDVLKPIAQTASQFDVFWNLYPRKVGKKKATALWSKLNGQEQQAVIKGLKLWKQAEQWHRDGGKFVPYASTFLAQRRWEDEPWTGALADTL